MDSPHFTSAAISGTNGWNRWHYAVATNNIQALHTLIRQQEDGMDETDDRNMTPLAYACALEYPSIVQLLLHLGCRSYNLEAPMRSPFVLAQHCHLDDETRMMMLTQVPVTQLVAHPEGHQIVHHALFTHNIRMFRYLIQHLDIDYLMAWLHPVICKDRIAFVRALCERIVDSPSFEDGANSALTLAMRPRPVCTYGCRSETAEIIICLVQMGAVLDGPIPSHESCTCQRKIQKVVDGIAGISGDLETRYHIYFQTSLLTRLLLQI